MKRKIAGVLTACLAFSLPLTARAGLFGGHAPVCHINFRHPNAIKTMLCLAHVKWNGDSIPGGSVLSDLLGKVYGQMSASVRSSQLQLLAGEKNLMNQMSQAKANLQKQQLAAQKSSEYTQQTSAITQPPPPANSQVSNGCRVIPAPTPKTSQPTDALDTGHFGNLPVQQQYATLAKSLYEPNGQLPPISDLYNPHADRKAQARLIQWLLGPTSLPKSGTTVNAGNMKTLDTPTLRWMIDRNSTRQRKALLQGNLYSIAQSDRASGAGQINNPAWVDFIAQTNEAGAWRAVAKLKATELKVNQTRINLLSRLMMVLALRDAIELNQQQHQLEKDDANGKINTMSSGGS